MFDWRQSCAIAILAGTGICDIDRIYYDQTTGNRLYDPENTDPHKAHAKFRPTCTGDPPQFFPPHWRYPTTNIAQSICAQEQFGGTPGIQIGGFCGYAHPPTEYDGILTNPQYQGKIRYMIDLAGSAIIPDESARGLHSRRTYLYCTLHCRCEGVDPNEVESLTDALYIHEDFSGYTKAPQIFRLDEKTLDATRDFPLPEVRKTPSGGERVVAPIKAYTILKPLRGPMQTLSIETPRDHRIECDFSGLPPLPNDLQHFRCNPYLVRSNLDDYDRAPDLESAGGFCGKTTTKNRWMWRTQQRDVLFTDELNPPNMSISPRRLFQLRFYCWLGCRCAWNPPVNPYRRPQLEYWKIFEEYDALRLGFQIAQLTGYESVDQAMRGMYGPKTGSLGIPRFSKQTISPVGQKCNGQCQDSASRETLSTLSPPFEWERSREQQCGGRCTGPESCRLRGLDPASCICRVSSFPSISAPPGRGPNTVFPIAVCGPAPTSDDDQLIKRHDLASGLNGQPCPCNTSYVSYGCCGSTTGLIWEEEHRWLGRLG